MKPVIVPRLIEYRFCVQSPLSPIVKTGFVPPKNILFAKYNNKSPRRPEERSGVGISHNPQLLCTPVIATIDIKTV